MMFLNSIIINPNQKFNLKIITNTTIPDSPLINLMIINVHLITHQNHTHPLKFLAKISMILSNPIMNQEPVHTIIMNQEIVTKILLNAN